MSQIKSISQVTKHQIVYHPIWGKGIIDEVLTHRVYVMFDSTDYVRHFLDVEFNKVSNIASDGLISHLYTEPVYICEKVTGSTATEVFGTIYKPISKEQ